MEYQKIINLTDKTPNQPTKFRTKKWIEIMMMQMDCIIPIVKLNLKLQCLCDYIDVYILVSGTVTVPNKGEAANPHNRKIK